MKPIRIRKGISEIISVDSKSAEKFLASPDGSDYRVKANSRKTVAKEAQAIRSKK